MEIENVDSDVSFTTSIHLSAQLRHQNREVTSIPSISSITSAERSPTTYRVKSKYSKKRKRDGCDTGFVGDSYFENQYPGSDAHYMSIPSWTLVAHHRFPTFFWECVNHYFDYQSWPEWDAMPEKFAQTCQRFQVSPSAVHHYPGWAPIWLYVLRKLDERWFKAVVENFFENHTLPTWDELPTSIVQKFGDLRIHEHQYFE